jgi:hypothetical protein
MVFLLPVMTVEAWSSQHDDALQRCRRNAHEDKPAR